MKVVRKPTPHYTTGRRGQKPIAIVIHLMAGTLAGTDAWFADPRSKVSAHYGVGKKGQVHQYVNEEDTAYHAGLVDRPTCPLIGTRSNPNLYTVGIEHEGRGDEPWTEEMYQASASLIGRVARRWGIPVNTRHVIPHRAIRASKTCPGYGVDLHRLIAMAAEMAK